jgi:hypothetical protein
MADEVIIDEIGSLTEEDQNQLYADFKELGVVEPPEEKAEVENEAQHEEHDDDEDDTPDADPEREAIRQRRREERRQKKLNRINKEDSYKREIDSLRRQLEEVNTWKNTVERRHVDTGIQQIDKALSDANSAINLAKQAIIEATKNQDGEAQVDAQELYYAARKRQEDLTRLKAGIAQKMAAPPQQNVDPVVIQGAKAWMDSKGWYDPAGKDMDSRITLQVDNQMAQEGWDPRSPEYWTELDNRLQKYLPHRFTGSNSGANMSTNETQRRNKPPTSGSSQGSGPVKAEGYRLSPEKVKAIKEAGMWDDPEKRKKMIKRYMDFDKNQGKEN